MKEIGEGHLIKCYPLARALEHVLKCVFEPEGEGSDREVYMNPDTYPNAAYADTMRS